MSQPIDILQLSLAALQIRIEHELASNPVLEQVGLESDIMADGNIPRLMPDATIEHDHDTGDYSLHLYSPRLYINDIYKRMAKTKSVDGKTREFIANNTRTARWFIESIEQRNNVLLRILRVMVDSQAEFLEFGPKFMKPFRLIDVADQSGIDVSTARRAIGKKYIQTPTAFSCSTYSSSTPKIPMVKPCIDGTFAADALQNIWRRGTPAGYSRRMH